jgi:D-alanyl-D-alanine carboxypeptidase
MNMKWILHSVLVLFFSCKSENLVKRGEYRGEPRLVFSDFSRLPGGNYRFDQDYIGVFRQQLKKRAVHLFDSLDLTGMSAAVVFPDSGVWQLNTGFVDQPAEKKVDENTLFHWASAGKMVTATLIHQLIEAGKLSYNDRLSSWYPEFPNAEAITIENLLNHTSGIYNFNADTSQFQGKGYTSPEQQIALAREKGNLFYPGEYWSYSNTNYTLLGRIIEALEGNPFHKVVEERIVNPLQLQHFQALAPRELPLNLARAHLGGQVDNIDYSAPFAAANIVANSLDMIRFLEALLGGELISRKMLEQMLTNPYPMFGDGIQHYGNGLMVYAFAPMPSDDIWIGHSGGFMHYKALVAFDYQSQAFAAVSINQDASAVAMVNNLLKVVR